MELENSELSELTVFKMYWACVAFVDRDWLLDCGAIYSVMPLLRDTSIENRDNRPTLGVLAWQTGELNVLHWQDEPWIRLKDMPSLLPGGTNSV